MPGASRSVSIWTHRTGSLFLDTFGRPYQLKVEGERVLIYSLGANGKDDGGGRDDIIDQWVTFVR